MNFRGKLRLVFSWLWLEPSIGFSQFYKRQTQKCVKKTIQKPKMYRYYIKEIIKIIDGDSLIALVDLGFHLYLEKNIRLMDIDSPELRTLDEEMKAYGLRSKEKLEEYLTSGDGRIILDSISNKDKYGRVLGNLYKEGKDVTASEYMIANGYAWPYSGGSKDDERLETLKPL